MTAVRLLLLAAASTASSSSSGPDYTFPEAKIENVYRAWKPIDYGHPLVDATIHYAPPKLERVHLGSGRPVPTRPTQQGGNSRNLVFEASRPSNEGRTDHRLMATVYHGKDLAPRDTVVTIPSQRRNDLIQQDPRHGRNQAIQNQLQPLKSGIFYVDDPHEEFRAKPPRRNPTLNRYHGADRMANDQSARISLDEPEAVHYVPISLLSTPPTIQTPQRPYGDIVNKDFNDSFKKQHRPLPRIVPPPNRGRKVAQKPSRNTIYPLGNPYLQAPTRQFGRPRLEGVLGPPNPRLDTYPTHAFGSRSSSSWVPAEAYNVHASGREIDYRKEPVIFHIKDSGELVDPGREPPAWPVNGGRSDTGGAGPGAPGPASLKGPASRWYDTQPGGPARTQGTRVRSAPEAEEMGYSADQLYYLCTQEVPEYLHGHLCKLPSSIITADSGFSERMDHDPVEANYRPLPTRNHSSPSFYEELTREEVLASPESTSLRSVSVRLPPKPQFQFVQDNQYVSSTEAMLQERSLPEDENNPYQLIYQTGTHAREEEHKDENTPFTYVQGATQGVPSPIVYSLAQSKVVVYRPNELTTTKPEPIISTTIITTTTTNVPPTTPLPTTARPFFYQAPNTPPPPLPLPKRINPQRQVIFNKRREGGGGVSRPFEYLSRLSSFLSDRVFTGRPSKARQRPDRPKLITRRTEGAGRR